MKLRWKKQIINLYTISVIVALPVLTFLFMGFESGMLPNFLKQVHPGESAAGDDLWVVSHIRYLTSYVDAIEWQFASNRHFIPILSSLAVLPFIQMRDRFLPFASVRMKNAKKMECNWIVQSVFLASCVMYCAYLVTMLVMRVWCVNTYDANNCFDVFALWGWNLSASTHPYLYLLALGVLRCFLLPILFSLLTIAISYLVNKVYIYLLIPTVYSLIASALFSQGLYEDRWPLPLFSPENLLWPSSPDYWGYGHTVHGIWGVVCAMAIVILPSIVMIWYGMRKRRA